MDVLHYINNEEVSRGGAQRILSLLLSENTEVVSLLDPNIPLSNKKWWVLFVQLASILFNSPQSRPSLVYVHSRCYLPVVWIYRLIGVKTIFYLHANYRKAPWLFRLFDCDGYIAVSDTVKKSLVKQGVASNKIVVIVNPHIVDNYVGTLFNSRAKYKFGSIGSLNSWKGFQEALVLLESSVNKESDAVVDYKIVGEGPLRKNLMDKSLLLDSINLIILGYKKNPFESLSDTPFIIIPSLEEGFGLVAIEAIYQNKIVIYSDIPALAEVCGDEPFCFPFDIGSSLSFLSSLEKARKVFESCFEEVNSEKRRRYIENKYNISDFTKSHDCYRKRISS